MQKLPYLPKIFPSLCLKGHITWHTSFSISWSHWLLGGLLLKVFLLVALPVNWVQAEPIPREESSQTVNNQPTENVEKPTIALLTSQELEQTILSLQLMQTLGLSSEQESAIAALESALRQKQENAQPSYELSPEQTQQLQIIFSSLSSREIAALNQLLVSQQPNQGIELTPQEIQGLLAVLQGAPPSNLNDFQQEQLQLIVEFLEELPQYRSYLLSTEQTEAMQSAIAQLFFSPETQPPIASSSQRTEPPSLSNTEVSQSVQERRTQRQSTSLTKPELQQIILTLQGVRTLNLQPSSEIQPLISQLLPLALQPQPTVELSANLNQTITNLLSSLSPQQKQELNQYLASERGSRQVYLGQQAIRNTQEFLNQLSPEKLTPSQQQARQELLAIFGNFEQQQEPVIALSPEQLQRINRLSATLPTAPTSEITLERETLETTLANLRDLPEEILSSQQQQERDRVITLLESLTNTEDATVNLTLTQAQEIAALSRNLPQLPPGTELVQRDRVLALLAAAQEQSLTPEQTEQLENLQTYFQNRQPLSENTTLTPAETEKVQALTAFLNTLESSQLTEIGGAIRTGGEGLGAGISIETPTGFGGAPNSVSVGALIQDRTRFTESTDGSISTAVSLGNPRSAVGVTSTVAIFSLSGEGGSDAGFGENGSLSFEINRNLSDLSSVGLGVENLVTWGVNDAGTSTYLSFSQAVPLREPTNQPLGIAFLSAGLGNGRFRPEEDFDRFDDGTQFNLFGSAALQLIDRTNLIVEWGGQDLNLGLSIAPFANIPVIINPAVVDLTGSAGDGARFTIGISYGTFF